MYLWQRKRYPHNWEVLSWACKQRAGWKCEQCGIAEGEWRVGIERAYRETLQAAHIDHDPENPNPRLMALCQACHLRYDAAENGKNMHRTKCRKKREAQLARGQLALLWEMLT